MTIGLTCRRTARRIKRLKGTVLTISPDYSDRPTPDFLALSSANIRAGPSTSRRPRHPGSNAVEGFFARLTKRRLKRGVFHSLVSLQEAINRFVAEANTEPKPFHWAKDLNTIIAAVRRGHQVLDYSG
jgi:hypothetical protein